MPKKLLKYAMISTLLFSLSIFFVYGQPGTCINPSGGDYCNYKSGVSACYCDSGCQYYKDCCEDYKVVCLNYTNYTTNQTTTTCASGTILVNGVCMTSGHAVKTQCGALSYEEERCGYFPNACNSGTSTTLYCSSGKTCNMNQYCVTTTNQTYDNYTSLPASKQQVIEWINNHCS